MSKVWVLGIALLLLLAALPLISAGTMGESATLWWIGLALLGAGGLIPPLTRYVYADEEARDADDRETDAAEEER